MAKNGIEIKGLEPLRNALRNLPDEVSASVIREIARKPGNKVVALARKLFTPNKTGQTKRTFGILKIRDRKQQFIEIGVKGRSLAWIFMLGASGRKRSNGASTGDIKSIGNVIEKAASQLDTVVKKDMQVDLSKAIIKALKRYIR